MNVLTKMKTYTKGKYTYEVMGVEGEPSHLHINNRKTNKDSVIVPISVLLKLLKED